ncbi:MAG: Xaa-Pro dipeptidase, partial [Deltaproteobacteria bacterium]|nr:Xaa-Pro dipeptidase [Deltaproteobacteria bacterium]
MDAENAVPIVVEGGRLVDGTGKRPLEDAVVIIEGQKIKTVSQRGKTQYPKEAKVINAQGKTILPGLWDTHVHYR